MSSTTRILRAVSSFRIPTTSPRFLHSSASRYGVTNFMMPAMSPTMTEGGIAQWKKKEGESFTPGEVLLEIETDKATIDVEAQDDGILGKIIAVDGTKNIPVGQLIALMVEEGDDISKLEFPRETTGGRDSAEAKALPEHPPTPAPTVQNSSTPTSGHSHQHIEHSRPLFPSVLRLLQENNVLNADKIKGTGVRGMLTKGDVLAFLGKASSPTGTYKESKKSLDPAIQRQETKSLDDVAVRKLILEGLTKLNAPPVVFVSPSPLTFDSILDDYLPSTASSTPKLFSSQPSQDYFNGLI